MIVLLEGPDGAGKTTLAQKLITDHVAVGNSVRLIRKGPIRDDVFTEYLRPLDELVGQPANTLWVLDRWHIGELIYGPLLRGRSELTERQAIYIDMVMQSFGCVFVHMSQDVEVLEARWDQRPDGLIKREWLGQIAYLYNQRMQSHKHWITAVGDIEGLNVAGQLPSPCPGRYIGPVRPSVLLLGDRRNQGTYTWPFVPAKATSGHWLMGALIGAEVDCMRVGLVNASEMAPVDLDTLWNTLGSPPVVTLGRHAERAWRMTERPVTLSVHHPQYMRRFHYRDHVEYGQRIKEVMTNV